MTWFGVLIIVVGGAALVVAGYVAYLLIQGWRIT